MPTAEPVAAVLTAVRSSFDEVAVDDAMADAVDDFVVDADADVAGEIVDERREDWAPFSARMREPISGEFGGRDAGADGGGHAA
jgi:hypothetical protein